MKTHRELMDDALAQLKDIDAEISEGVQEVDDALSRLIPSRSQPTSVNLQIALTPEGHRRLKAAGASWRVPIAAVVRIVLADGLGKLGFNVDGVVLNKDVRYLRRHHTVEQPLMTYAAAQKARRLRHDGALVHTENLRPDDPS